VVIKVVGVGAAKKRREEKRREEFLNAEGAKDSQKTQKEYKKYGSQFKS
jgi:hypothetical protein